MSLDLPTLHSRALRATGTYVAGITAGRWHDPTPCSEWDVREIVNHLVGENYWAGELFAGKSIADVGTTLDGDLLGEDPRAAWDASAEIAIDALHAPGAMEVMVGVSYGPVPGEVYAGHLFIDMLIHGWDIATATGQDTTLDPELVEACIAVVLPQAEMLSGSGMFGHVMEPEKSDRQSQLLAMLGRRA